MSDPIKLTPLQLECLVNAYLRDQAWCGKREHDLRDWDEADRGLVLPPWGRPARFGHVSRMGGAVARMHEALADAEFFPSSYSDRGYRRLGTEPTAKALKALKAKYPSLPDIDQRIEQAIASEQAAREAEQAKQAESRRIIAASAERRKEARAEQMAAILRDYQISHALTPDQLRAIWLRVCDEEHQL